MATDHGHDLPRLHLLRTRLGGQRVLVAASEVLRVIPYTTPHPVPRARPGLAGVLFESGQVIGVADVSGLLFGESPAPSLLLIAGEAPGIAIPIEAAEGVESCSVREITRPPSTLPIFQRRFARAVREDLGTTMLVLNSRAVRDYISGCASGEVSP